MTAGFDILFLLYPGATVLAADSAALQQAGELLGANRLAMVEADDPSRSAR